VGGHGWVSEEVFDSLRASLYRCSNRCTAVNLWVCVGRELYA